MPVDRMRMRPWLEQMVDSEKIPGVAWIDKDRTMFTIPWKHAARHGWEMDKDACLFKEWAIHTGKHSEGQACDPKTWKANFRCAMNSLPDIEEVKDRSVKKGQEARRVFKMLPVTKRARDRRSKARERKTRKKGKSEDDSDYSDSHSPANKAMLDEALSSSEGSVDMEAPDYQSQSVHTISHTVEITTEHYSNFNYRFEVSPAHSKEDSLCNMNELWRPMENDTELTSGTHSQSYTSLDPAWSDSSSDIVDSTAQYTALGSDLGLIQDNMLSCYLDS